MSNRFLMSAALAALIASAGVVNAQSPNAGPAGGATGGAPSAGERGGMSGERAAPGGGAMSRESGPAGRGAMDRGSDMDRGQTTDQRANDERGNDQRGGAMNRNAEDRNSTGRDNPRAAEDRNNRSQTTTGQAGAGGKQMTSEQRTRVSTVIRNEKVAPVTNINFSISVGTRVPRDIAFHPVPAEIVTIYPDWRGYQFFLARDEIIVVDPATFEIVAVLPA